MGLLTIDGVLRAVQQLPALPQVVIDLMGLFDQDEPDVGAISRRIEKDQAIAARVFRLANSPFYGMAGRIDTIGDGVRVLGLRNLHNLTMAAGITGSFPASRPDWFDHGVFWRHTIVVAMSARVLAVRFDLGSPDLAFITGLLHDIGKLALVTGFPDAYREVVRRQDADGLTSTQAEQAVLGLDHAMVGAALARRWKFAPVIEAAIGRHHDPAAAGSAALTDLVHAADVTAHLLRTAGDPRSIEPAPWGAVWAGIAGDWEAFRQILPVIEAEATEAAISLGFCEEHQHA